MPWKDGYTSSDEIAIADRDLLWPAGVRLPLHIVVNLNPAAGAEGITEADLASPTWHFGMHEGLEAFLSLFEETGARATFAVPALVAEACAAEMDAIVAAGHEIAAQGLLGEDPGPFGRSEEGRRMASATEAIARVAGSRPVGWYALPHPDDGFATGSASPHTIRLLREHGYAYFGGGLADDAPYWCVSDFQAKEALITLPYYFHFDDTFFLMFPREGTGLERPGALLRNWEAEFAAQYRRGRFFAMTISPARSGWGHRLDTLAAFLRKATSMPGVWAATGRNIAAHWSAAFPAETHLRLEPPIWRDYPDSLS